MANKLLNASDFFKGGYNFLAPTDAWEKSDDTTGFELGFDYLGSICPFILFLGGHFPFLRVA